MLQDTELPQNRSNSQGLSFYDSLQSCPIFNSSVSGLGDCFTSAQTQNQIREQA
jgi:hypothetical protein